MRAGKFKPTKISDCELWLDASQGVSTIDDKVNSWADQSGNSRNASQSTSSYRPTLVPAEPKHVWSGKLYCGTNPRTLFGHTSVIYGNFMYIFGGYTVSGNSYYGNYTYKLDLINLVWSSELVCSGTKPVIRDYHTSVVYNNYMYIFG